ncbi:hypothetical protein LSAT2_024088 [Lamellibrachia satsuma]|nr:hypothetical protein LSAT2_024088 [Lamellibrachia satsuma]
MTTINGNTPTLVQRMKPAAVGSQSIVANGVNDEDDMKIQEFMTWHNNRVKRGRRDIPVKELRHIIPAFILRCFAMKEDQPTQKKVKGLWERPPTGWNPKVPFLDPNNKGDQGKPKKEVLMQMFEYLVKVYQRSCNTAVDLTKGPIQESEVAMDSEDVDEGRPVEVADDAEDYDWNPLEDCLRRIKQKIHFVNNMRLSNGEIGTLNVTKDLLFRLFDQLGKIESLRHAHRFEYTLDVVKSTDSLPADLNQEWREFEAEGNKLNDDPHTLEKQQPLMSEDHIKELGISTQHNPLVCGQTAEFSNVVSVRNSTEKLMFFEDELEMYKKGVDNDLKFADVNAIITDETRRLNEAETGELAGSGLDVSEDEDVGLEYLYRMFENSDSEAETFDVGPGSTDLSDFLDYEMKMWDNEQSDKLLFSLCEDVHTPNWNRSAVDDANKDYPGDVGEDGFSVQPRKRHDSVECIDSDHSYVQKTQAEMSTELNTPTSAVCSQVQNLTISSPLRNCEETTFEDVGFRGTKRGYSDAGYQIGPKQRRTEDMDIEGGDTGEADTAMSATHSTDKRTIRLLTHLPYRCSDRFYIKLLLHRFFNGASLGKSYEILDCPVIRIPLSALPMGSKGMRRDVWHQLGYRSCRKSDNVITRPSSGLHSGFV